MRRINQQIYLFVQDSLKKGYDIYTIRNNLVKQYPLQEVDEVINIFLRQQQEQQLKNYVNQQIALGFKPELIKSTLLQRGYNKDLVDSAFNNNITVRHEIHFPIKTVVIIISLLIISGAGYWFLNLRQSEALLDVSVQSNSQEYLAGQEITYNIELINMGKSKRFDANVRYIITDVNDKILKSSSETLAVETKASSSGKIVLPSSLSAGTYYLKTIVTYGNNQKAESFTEFQIVDETSPAKTNTGETSNQDSTTGTGIGSGGIIPRTTPQEKSFGETMTAIRHQAVNNSQGAINNCLKFSSQEQKDVCISQISYNTNKFNYCEQISAANIKDNCYLAFVIGGNTQVCDKIIDETNKKYCNQIKIVKQMNDYYQQGNTEKLLEVSKQFEPAIYETIPPSPDYQSTYSQPSTLTIEDFSITAELNESG